MKKLISITLAIVLMLTLVACGSAQNQIPAVSGGGQQTESTPSENPSPETTEPETTEPETTEPETTEPETTEPETTEPEATEPEVTEPEVTEPEVTEPKPTEPKPTEPKPTNPKPTEPEEPKPQEPVVKNEFFNDTNYEMEEGNISVKPRRAYWKDGELVVECFVINGRSYFVRYVEVTPLRVETPDGDLIAEAFFDNCHEEDVKYGDWYIQTFVFPKECVLMPNADLQSLILKYGLAWNDVYNQYDNQQTMNYSLGAGELFEDDTAVLEKKLDVRVRWAFWENGALKVRLLVANGLDTVATNINVTNLTFTNAQGIIATEAVGVLQQDGTIVSVEPGQYVDVDITISNGIVALDADLISAWWTALCSYSY